MTRIPIFVLLLLFVACGRPCDVYVGTYSGAVHLCSFEDGAFVSDSVAARIADPSYLCLAPEGLYAVSETMDSSASLNFITPDGIKPAPTLSAGPCHVSVQGSMAVTSNYAGGSLSVFRLPIENGPVQTIPGSTGGPDTLRQCEPHVHCAVFSPDGKYLLASDFSADRILCFSVCDTLVPHSFFTLHPDTGPRHILFNGSVVYVIGELSGNIDVLSFKDGNLSLVQTVEADPAHTRASADIRISPDGRHLYASNRLGKDGVAVYDVAENGTLSMKDYVPTAANPRNIALSPDGRFLLVASQNDNVIEVYSRDGKTGLLTDTGNRLHVEKPVCIVFDTLSSAL